MPVDWESINYFGANEFEHPDLLDPLLVFAMDEIRILYGKPLRTSWRAFGVHGDARFDNPASLHYADLERGERRCRALDFIFAKMPEGHDLWEEMWNLDGAVRHVANSVIRPQYHLGVEWEVEWHAKNKHFHFGLFYDDRPHRFVLKLAA